MIELLSELSDQNLRRQVHKLEEEHHKIMDELHLPQSHYERDILYTRRDVCLNQYLAAVYEAAYRNLITLH